MPDPFSPQIKLVLFSSIFLLLAIVVYTPNQSFAENKQIDHPSITNFTTLDKHPSAIGITVDNYLPFSDTTGSSNLSGLLVKNVTPSSSAEKAGILDGDILLKVDNKILKKRDFILYIQGKQKGDNITLDIYRDGNIIQKNLTVTANLKLVYDNPLPYSDPAKINFSINISSNVSRADPNVAFKIEYPSIWTIEEKEELFQKQFIFRSMPENQTDNARDYLSLMIFPNKGKLDQEMAVRTNLTDFKIEKPVEHLLDNGSMRQIVYKYFEPDVGKIKVLRVGIIENGLFYMFNYFAQESRFDNYLNTIEKMINSFQILKTDIYINFDGGYRINTYSDWNITEQKSSYDFFDRDKTVSFFLPSENKTSFSNRIDISSKKLSVNSSLEYIEKETITNYLNDYFNYHNFELINSSPFNHKDNSSIILQYKYVDPITTEIIYASEIVTKHNNKKYSISYSAQENEYYKILPFFYEVVDSLEFFELIPYENLNIGMKFEYPSDWHYTFVTEERTLDKSDSVLFTPIKDTLSYSPQNNEGIKIFSYPIVHQLPLDEIVNQTINYYKHELHVSNFNLINQSNTLLPDGTPSKIISYFDSERKIMNKEIITEKYGRIYHILLSVEEKVFPLYDSVLNEIFSSSKLFDIIRYEKNINDVAGIILKYSNYWTIKEANDTSFDSFSPQYSTDPQIIVNIAPYRESTNYLINHSSKINNSSLEQINITTTTGKLINANKTTYTYSFNGSKYGESNVKVINISLIFKNYLYSISYMEPLFLHNHSTLFLEDLIDSINIINFSKPMNKDFDYFENINYNFKIKKPIKWKIINYTPNVIGLEENLTDNYYKNFNMQIISIAIPSTKSADEMVTNDLQAVIKEKGSTYKLIQFKKELRKYIEYTTEYIDDKTHYLNKYIIDKDKKSAYIIKFDSALIQFYNYLPIVKEIIKNFKIEENSKPKILTGFPVAQNPAGITINPNTNKLYIANSYTNTISVIDSVTSQVLKTIKVGNYPTALLLDPILNLIYVLNVDSGSVSVIEGSNDKLIKTIPVGPSPTSISINPYSHKTYVADGSNYDVYVIDSLNNNSDITQIKTGGGIRDLGIGIAVNELTNNIYVANPATNNITVINGDTNRIVKNISIPAEYDIEGNEYPPRPFDISLNPFTNIAYVINSGLGSIITLDTSKNSLVGNPIKLSNGSLNLVSVNKFNNMIYVTDTLTNTIYTINATMNNKKTSLIVDPTPNYMYIHPDSNLIYVSSFDSKTITIINGTTNTIMYSIKYHLNKDKIDYNILGQNFQMNASKNAVLYCDKKEIVNDIVLLYNNNSKINCNVKSNNIYAPILFREWTGLIPKESNSVSSFNVINHNTINAGFIDLENILHKLAPIINLLVLISVIIFASIPSIMSKIRQYKHHRQQTFLLVDKRKPELLEKTEIIGIDASIIVGVLIFFTITEGFETTEQTEISLITAAIIFPFTISVIMALTNRNDYATRLAIAGFVNLIISTILIVLMKVGY